MPPSPTAQLMIRPVREFAGVSLRELARRIGVSVGTMSGIETGKTALSDERFASIARALDTTTTAISQFAQTETESETPVSAVERPFDWREYPELELDLVLTAAIRCFVETGYHGATMRTIATEAGISVPGVYHHYPNKQSLLVAIFDLAAAELTAHTLSAAAESPNPTIRLSNLSEATVLFAALRRDLALIALTEANSLTVNPAHSVRGWFDDLVGQFADSITTAAPRGADDDPSGTARAAVELCLSVCRWFSGDATAAAVQSGVYAEYVRRLAGLA